MRKLHEIDEVYRMSISSKSEGARISHCYHIIDYAQYILETKRAILEEAQIAELIEKIIAAQNEIQYINSIK